MSEIPTPGIVHWRDHWTRQMDNRNTDWRVAFQSNLYDST